MEDLLKEFLEDSWKNTWQDSWRNSGRIPGGFSSGIFGEARGEIPEGTTVEFLEKLFRISEETYEDFPV